MTKNRLIEFFKTFHISLKRFAEKYKIIHDQTRYPQE